MAAAPAAPAAAVDLKSGSKRRSPASDRTPPPKAKRAMRPSRVDLPMRYRHPATPAHDERPTGTGPASLAESFRLPPERPIYAHSAAENAAALTSQAMKSPDGDGVYATPDTARVWNMEPHPVDFDWRWAVLLRGGPIEGAVGYQYARKVASARRDKIRAEAEAHRHNTKANQIDPDFIALRWAVHGKAMLKALFGQLDALTKEGTPSHQTREYRALEALPKDPIVLWSSVRDGVETRVYGCIKLPADHRGWTPDKRMYAVAEWHKYVLPTETLEPGAVRPCKNIAAAESCIALIRPRSAEAFCEYAFLRL